MSGPSHAERGAVTALESVCFLESRLRQARQNSGSLRTIFGSAREQDDRELYALQRLQEQLELLEEKLRDFCAKSGDPHFTDDHETIVLTQIDALRKDLLTEARNSLPLVCVSKDVVKDILAFADNDSDGRVTPRADSPADGIWAHLSPSRSPISDVQSEPDSPGRSPAPFSKEEDGHIWGASLQQPVSSVSPRQSHSASWQKRWQSGEDHVPPYAGSQTYPGTNDTPPNDFDLAGWEDDPFPKLRIRTKPDPAAKQQSAGNGTSYGGHLNLKTFKSRTADAGECFGLLPEKSRVCEVIGPDRAPPVHTGSETDSSTTSFTFAPAESQPMQPGQSHQVHAGPPASTNRNKGWAVVKRVLLGAIIVAGLGKALSGHRAGSRQRAKQSARLSRDQEVARRNGMPGYPGFTGSQNYLGSPHYDSHLPSGPMFPTLPAPDPMRGRG